MVWKVLSPGSREHTLIFLWVLFLDPLYIHRDAKIIIVRVGFLKSAFMKRINRRDLLVSLPEFDGFLVRKPQNERSFGDPRYVNVFLVEMDGFRCGLLLRLKVQLETFDDTLCLPSLRSYRKQ